MSLKMESRKTYILNTLQKHGSVSTEQLMRKFSVSSETIRRTFDELVSEAHVVKVYGGAVLASSSSREPSYRTREEILSKEKREIGKITADYITDNDSVFIDEGTTPAMVVPFLKRKKNIIIITNSISVLNQFTVLSNDNLFSGKVLFIGGWVDFEHKRTLGADALTRLKKINFNKAVLSADGLDIDRGITCISPEKAEFSKVCVDIADCTILNVDNSKLCSKALVSYAEISDIDIIVCDVPPPAAWKSKIKKMNTKWYSIKT
jgi:DeoR/GlpR family transcriptional regulator of sugar metabolism